MTDFFDFLSLMFNEADSLIEICPVSIQSVITGAFMFSLILACKRVIID